MNQESILKRIKDVNLTAKPTLKHWSKRNPQVNTDKPDQRQSNRHQLTNLKVLSRSHHSV